MRSFAEIIKDSPGVGDVHVSSASRRRRRRGQLPLVQVPLDEDGVYKLDRDIRFDVPISKVNDELRTVYGFASVSTVKGAFLTDTQDDQVEDAVIIKAAHDFMANSRTGGLLHAMRDDGRPHQGGQIVESLVFTPDIQKALGVDLGVTGWFIGYRVDDDDAWSLVKSGDLKAFSIGGRAARIPVVGVA